VNPAEQTSDPLDVKVMIVLPPEVVRVPPVQGTKTAPPGFPAPVRVSSVAAADPPSSSAASVKNLIHMVPA
jgi:hypothetical protein